MHIPKNILIKIGKYFILAVVGLAGLFVLLEVIIAEDIEIGGSCGTYIKRTEFYNPTDCGWCLGKLVKDRESEGFIDYKCVGIKFSQMYE